MQLQSPWITAAVLDLDHHDYDDHHDHEEAAEVSVAAVAVAAALLLVELAAVLDQFHIHHLLLHLPISEEPDPQVPHQAGCHIVRFPSDDVTQKEGLSLVHGKTDLLCQLVPVLLSLPWLCYLFAPGNLPHLHDDYHQEAAYLLQEDSVELESLAEARSHPD